MNQDAPQVMDADGTMHVPPRRVPLPAGLSAEARAYLTTPPPLQLGNGPFWVDRAAADENFRVLGELQRQRWPVIAEELILDGVRVHRVATPQEEAAERVLINVHGGGFVMGAGSIAEAVPFAHLTGAPVYCIDYRLAPEHPYPAAVEDCLAAYSAILKRHPGVPIGLYGSSAGASLVFQLLHELRTRELPLPGAIGAFSPPADLSDFGDSGRLFTMAGLWGDLHVELDHEWSEVRAYLGGLDPRDPRVSPVYGDLRDYPPTLLVSGTRDILLSGTTRLHRRLLDAKVTAELVVFEGMPHCHWFAFHLPEADEFLRRAGEFFDRRLQVERAAKVG